MVESLKRDVINDDDDDDVVTLLEEVNDFLVERSLLKAGVRAAGSSNRLPRGYNICCGAFLCLCSPPPCTSLQDAGCTGEFFNLQRTCSGMIPLLPLLPHSLPSLSFSLCPSLPFSLHNSPLSFSSHRHSGNNFDWLDGTSSSSSSGGGIPMAMAVQTRHLM